MPLGQSQDISQADPEGRVPPRFWHHLIRFRHFIGGSLALASLNLACRDHVPTFPQRSPPSLLTTAACVRRATRRRHSAEEKIRIVLEGLRGEDSIAELCRKEGINQNLYYRWSKEFLEAGKKRLAGDTAREATSDEVKQLKAEARQLKETLAEVLIENRLLKKSVLGDGEDAS